MHLVMDRRGGVWFSKAVLLIHPQLHLILAGVLLVLFKLEVRIAIDVRCLDMV